MKIGVNAKVTLLFPDVGSAWTGGHTVEQITREARTVAMGKLRKLIAVGGVEVRLIGEPDVSVTIDDVKPDQS